jgi:hypothetical protein
MTRRIAAGLVILGPALLAQDGLAGTYKGKWAGMSAAGDFTLRLEKSGPDWKGAVTFTIADTEVPTKVSFLEVKETTIEMKYEFDLGGNQLQSHLQGEFKEGELTGKYRTRPVADLSIVVDEGTCSAKRA